MRATAVNIWSMSLARGTVFVRGMDRLWGIVILNAWQVIKLRNLNAAVQADCILLPARKIWQINGLLVACRGAVGNDGI